MRDVEWRESRYTTDDMWRERLTAGWVHLSPETGCLIWRRALDSKGYGSCAYRGKTVSAHRLSYLLFNGDVDSGMSVCHACDTPACVNPTHLFLGTHTQNMHDMDRKGRRRSVQGSRHPRAKITEADVVSIRSIHAERRFSLAEIGSRFGLSRKTVCDIANFRKWAHVTAALTPTTPAAGG